MNQPDLGTTIAELRAQKGLTQETLAEYCDVSKRTIQRIESGEVEPRAFTLNNLSNILEFDFNDADKQNDAIWLTALHLSSTLLFGIVIIPLLIWSRKKKQSYKIDQHGRAVLNFQITVMLMMFAATIFLLIALGITVVVEAGGGTTDLIYTAIAVLGSLPFMVIGAFSLFQGVLNAARTLSEKPVKYRLSIPFIK